MSDTHERPTLSRNTEQEHSYFGLDPYWNFEVWGHGSRERSYAKIAVGLAGLLADLLLSAALINGAVVNPSAVIVGLIVIVVASASSVWLLNQGFEGLQHSRPSPLPHQHRSIRGSGRERQEQSAEKQLLEAIERNGEITPARAALQTSLTVDEAERVLSDLAQRGHLDLRVEGSRLVYSL
ncbi:MAG: hypothetical protein ACRDTR_13875 [Rubrobacter sp.]